VPYKETIAWVGGDSTGKSSMILDYAQHHPSVRVAIIDFEGKLEKIREVYYPDVDNVDAHRVFEVEEVLATFEDLHPQLKAGDALAIDGLPWYWDMLQDEYDPNNDKLKEMWKWIKERHNKRFLDKMARSQYNILATLWAAPNPDHNIQRETDAEVREDLLLWKQFGFKPAGEKRNTSRFDTVFGLRTNINPVRHQVATYKDKGRPYLSGGKRDMWMDFEFPFWPKYMAACQEAVDRGERVAMPE